MCLCVYGIITIPATHLTAGGWARRQPARQRSKEKQNNRNHIWLLLCLLAISCLPTICALLFTNADFMTVAVAQQQRQRGEWGSSVKRICLQLPVGVLYKWITCIDRRGSQEYLCQSYICKLAKLNESVRLRLRIAVWACLHMQICIKCKWWSFKAEWNKKEGIERKVKNY